MAKVCKISPGFLNPLTAIKNEAEAPENEAKEKHKKLWEGRFTIIIVIKYQLIT